MSEKRDIVERLDEAIAYYNLPLPDAATEEKFQSVRNLAELLRQARQEIAARDARIAELEGVVERLPKTADGKRVGPGSVVYIDLRESNRWWIFGIAAAQTEGWDTMSPVATFRNTPEGNKPGDLETIMFDIEHCYSTPEAASAARSTPDGKGGK